MRTKTVGRSALTRRLLGVAMIAGMLPALAAASCADQPGVLAVHNQARAAVGVAPIRWSNTLSNDAQSWASHLVAIHQLQHSLLQSRPGVGENLARSALTESDPVGKSDSELVRGWVAEKQYFIPHQVYQNACKPGKICNHYTQVIWRNTTAVGCAWALDLNQKQKYFVCRYQPAGNVLGQYPY